jgi:methionyl-tRNA synthetase
MAKFLLCNSIPYVNANPHVGHALEFTQSDVIARFRKSLGDDVLLLSGGDENAIKNVQAAEKANQPIQEFIDEHTVRNITKHRKNSGNSARKMATFTKKVTKDCIVLAANCFTKKTN